MNYKNLIFAMTVMHATKQHASSTHKVIELTGDITVAFL